jgi:hypothetical protein
MNSEESNLLIEAVFIWTGRGQKSWPHRDESALINHFGAEKASKLLSTIKFLQDDFYSSNANLIADNLQEMGKMASEEFRKKHPDIPEEIVQAFVWCYTFDYK